MTAKDIPQVMEIEELSFKMPWGVESFVEELKFPISYPLVAVDGDDNVLGYVIARVTEPVLHIINIAVREDARGCGIGSALMKRAFEIARNEKLVALYLEVRVSNRRAISLYKKFEFGTIRRIKNYYSDGEDAYAMVAPLNGTKGAS